MYETSGDKLLLLCPICEGGEHFGLIANVSGGVQFGDVLEDFQGGGRYAISIAGWCEQHEERFAYVFCQHEGQTYIKAVGEEKPEEVEEES